MRVGIIFVVFGVTLVIVIIGLFWLKDRLQNERLARLAYSEPIARLAVVGAAVTVIGLLLIFSSLW
jgi:uncharacterized membrane protein YciS (DUF1049 family)